MITGNKGEWSEIYTLFKLLGDIHLFPGNKQIEKIKDVVFPILKIFRTENNGLFEYSIEDEIIVISGNDTILEIPVQTFKEKAIFLLDIIKQNKQTTFSVPEIEEFMHTINCLSLKANSKVKSDITIVIHDQRTNQQPILGFSIKSQLGSPSTLLNAGRTTNFIYQIKDPNLSSIEIDRINSLVIVRGKKHSADIKARVKELKDRYNCQISFLKTENSIFSNNLRLIDSKLPEILAEILLKYNSSDTAKLSSIVETVAANNPLNFDGTNHHPFYHYKVKRFLTDTSLGMMPSKVWSGKFEATGGYLVVKDNGDVLCYHVYNRNEFEDYLFHNTKLETASSSRHKFGEIYKENGNLLLKLNLQIRFIK